MTETFKAVDICEHAAKLVGGDRAKQNGGKLENHRNIAVLWTAYLGVAITPHQVALMMVLLKVARTKGGTRNRDDYVDIAGYAGVAAEITQEAEDQYQRLCGNAIQGDSASEAWNKAGESMAQDCGTASQLREKLKG